MALIAALSFPMAVVSVDQTPLPIAQRFPVPAFTWGRSVDVADVTPNDGSAVEGLGPPYYIPNAVLPEGLYMEPTLGQIWPRIG